MKFFAIPCLIAAGLLTGPAIAEQPDTDIEVSAPTSVAAWSDSIGDQLDRSIGNKISSYSLGPAGTPTGLASVRFHNSQTGEPTAIELIRRSGNSRLNSMAKSVVADIKTLHPLPAGVGPDQVFVANILVAADQQAYDRDMATLRDEAQRHNRMAAGAARPIAINVSANAR